jgi:hypothetical protein
VEVIDTHSRGTVIEGCTPLADDDPLRHHLPERVRRGAAQDLHRITPGWLTHVPVDLGGQPVLTLSTSILLDVFR